MKPTNCTGKPSETWHTFHEPKQLNTYLLSVPKILREHTHSTTVGSPAQKENSTKINTRTFIGHEFGTKLLVIKISNLLVPDGTPNNSIPPSQKIQTRIFWFRMILPPTDLTINFSNLLVQNDVPDRSNPPNQKIQTRIFWFGINYSLDYSGSESRVCQSHRHWESCGENTSNHPAVARVLRGRGSTSFPPRTTPGGVLKIPIPVQPP